MTASAARAVDDIHKWYCQGRRAVHAVKGVSALVAAGETCELLQRNGGGKTTLVKILFDIARANPAPAMIRATQQR